MVTLTSGSSTELNGDGLANIHRGKKLSSNLMMNCTYYGIIRLLITNIFT